MSDEEALQRLLLALERIADALDELVTLSQSCHTDE